jgi:two-component system nitrogen regulation sensor histidine kinase NtrY
MTLRLKFILYLVAIHLLFAGVAIYLLLQHRIWLLAVELVFVVSLTGGLKLTRSLFGTIELIQTGAQFMRDRDFSSRFREVGHPEMDQLIQIYNRMADHLREERTKLQEQNYFLDNILAASPSGIITLDFDNQIAMINPAAERLLQTSKEELLGKRLADLETPFASELDVLQPGESKVLPLLGRRRVKCRKSQFLDRGFLRHFVLMEELTEELRQSEKAAYEKLIRLMSHEVNNSVASANSLLHSCLNYKDQLEVEDRRDYEAALAVVIARTEQLNAFMKSFADVVRLPKPQVQPCDVQELLESISLLMRAESSQRQIEWKFELHAQLDAVPMDRGQMEQVFLNIVKNAIEAIGERGTITIRSGIRAGRRFVEIEDTGCGISPQVRANLFTPFFSTKEHGQGIGLTLIEEILDQHRFEFALEGQPGGPTRFTIQL